MLIRRPSIWDNKKIQNLCKLLSAEVRLRRIFFSSYKNLLVKAGIIENPDFFKVLSPKDTFVPPKLGYRYPDQVFARIDSPGVEFYKKILLHSIMLKDVVQKCIEFEVFDEVEPFFICRACKRIVQNVRNRCPNCRRELQLKFPLYKIPRNILDLWVNNPQKFLEALCYVSIKTSNLPTIKSIFSGTLVSRRDEFFPETEMDVSVLFNQNSPELGGRNDLVIICTVNPRQSAEKRQAKIFYGKLKSAYIVVTTASSLPTRMEKKAFCVFTKIDRDSDFPVNLIKCLREIKFA